MVIFHVGNIVEGFFVFKIGVSFNTIFFSKL
jgi:hypothetical protein